MTGHEIGAVFEREIIKGLVHLMRIQLDLYTIGPSKSRFTSGPLIFSKIDKIIHFDANKEFPSTSSGCNLLKPLSQTHKYWDFLIQDHHTKQIIFVQTSTLSPNTQKMLKVQNSFTNRDENERNQIEKYLDSLLQLKGSKACIVGKCFDISLPLDEWTVKFLYITSQHDDATKQCSIDWDDLLVAGRETLAPLYLRFMPSSPKNQRRISRHKSTKG